jgi:hypothetical protein
MRRASQKDMFYIQGKTGEQNSSQQFQPSPAERIVRLEIKVKLINTFLCLPPPPFGHERGHFGPAANGRCLSIRHLLNLANLKPQQC